MEALRLTAVQTTLTLIFGFASLLCTTALVPLVWLLPLVALVVIYNTFVYLGEFTITITKWGVRVINHGDRAGPRGAASAPWQRAAAHPGFTK